MMNGIKIFGVVCVVFLGWDARGVDGACRIAVKSKGERVGSYMEPTVFEAIHTLHNPLEAGLYNEIRSRAVSYPFAFSTDREGSPVEGGSVCFAWNKEGFYVAAELEDSFLISENRSDEQLHYEFGDLLELFMKPADDTYYWEMYATAFGNKSTLFFPRNRTGMDVDGFLHAHPFQGLEVSVEKTSKGWNAQMWVPAEQLKALGMGWGSGSRWRVFCGRYNYDSAELKDPKLSMVPSASKTNYHLTNEYAVLRFCVAR